MKLNGAALNEYRFKSLNTQTVKRRSTVKHNRVILYNIFKNIPDDIGSTVNKTLSCLDVLCVAIVDKAFHNKRLEQFQRHFLGQAALVHFEFRTDNNNGTA